MPTPHPRAERRPRQRNRHPLLLLALLLGACAEPQAPTPERAEGTPPTLAAEPIAPPPPAPAAAPAPAIVPVEQSLRVTASAYNSLAAQTNAHPSLTAWGDTLKPGMRAIAVSRDLIPLGLGHGARVRIDGLEGEYVVRDKMHRRWSKKIDIYMGNDLAAARAWGRRQVTIHWQP